MVINYITGGSIQQQIRLKLALILVRVKKRADFIVIKYVQLEEFY